MFTFNVGEFAVLALLNLTTILQPAVNEGVPEVIETVFAAVPAATEHVPKAFIVNCLFLLFVDLTPSIVTHSGTTADRLSFVVDPSLYP